jgi:hypothetical protein
VSCAAAKINGGRNTTSTSEGGEGDPRYAGHEREPKATEGKYYRIRKPYPPPNCSEEGDSGKKAEDEPGLRQRAAGHGRTLRV